MIKAVIFDFDGLILDTETAWFEAYQETLAAYQIEIPHEQFVKCIGSGDTHFFIYLEQQLGDPSNLPEIKVTASVLHQEKMKSPIAREGVKDYLEEAKQLGLKIALASSSSNEWVTNFLTELQLIHYFDLIVSRDDVEKVKPAPDLFEKAVEQLQIDATEAVVFEDSLNGLQAALAAGLKCVIVPNPVTEALAFENHHLRLQSMSEKSLTEVIKLIES